MKEINIGLMGFEFKSPNKGCEALSYSFVKFLSRELKGYKVNIYSWDTELGDIPSVYPEINFVYVKPKIKDIKMKFLKVVSKCDCVFDVTRGDGFSDIYSKESCSKELIRKQLVEKFSKKYVLMPQTYGPFEDLKIRKKAMTIINNAYSVMSRDELSISYMKEYGLKRDVKQYIDLAFMLPYDSLKYSIDKSRKNLGINVSGLLYRGGFERNNQFGLSLDYKEFIREIIRYYSSNSQWCVHLIPHVIDDKENAHDDDCFAIKELKKEFPEVVLAPFFDNPVNAKSYISNMDLFVGSRMHSTIAAISAGIPVIPVSYSRKFEGLFGVLEYQYLIDGRNMNNIEAKDSLIKYIDEYDSILSAVKSTETIINDNVEILETDLRKILNGLI